MKKNLLKSMVLMALMLLGTSVSAQTTMVTTAASDSWIRTDNVGATQNNESVEMKNFTKEDGSAQKFYGVMTFDFTQPNSGNEVKSAVLRLTTRYAKGKRGVSVYALPNAVDAEAVNYNNLGSTIETVLKGSPIAQFDVKSEGTKAIFDKGLSEAYQTVAAWQNIIDLTAYLRTVKAGSFSILLVKDAEENSSTQVYSKDYKEVKWNAELGTAIAGTLIPEEEIIPQLTVEYQEATGVTTKTLAPTADTYVRKGNTGDNSTKTSMEVYTLKNDEKDLDFVGLMAFELPAEHFNNNYEVESATLRLVSKRVKGARNVSIYNLGGDFAENAKYEDVASLLTAARATTAIAKFEAAGQWNKDFEIDGLNEELRTADKWTNYIDLTDYVKTLGTNKLNIAICGDATIDEQKIFFTKEATGFTNDKDGSFTVEGKDLVPQLTIVYKSSTGINTIEAPVRRTREGIYTLSGQRVSKMGRGIYIVNGKKICNK